MNKNNLISLNNHKEWNKYLSEENINPGQTWEYNKIESLHTGFETYLIKLNLNKNIFCPFHFLNRNGKTEIFTPRGYSGFNIELNQELIERLKIVKKNLNINKIYFTNNPYIKDDANNLNNSDILKKKSLCYFFYNNKKYNFTLNSKFEEKNVKIFNNYNNDKFLDLYKKNLTAWGESPNNILSYKAVEFLCKFCKNAIFLSYIVNNIEKIILVFLTTPTSVYHLMSLSGPEGQGLNANMLKYASEFFFKEKIKKINLGGGVKEKKGVEEFKKRLTKDTVQIFSINI